MKKIITALIISALVIVLGGTAVFAAGRYFTDADADGICDYRNTDCYAEYNYSNADNRTGICPCNNSCTPKYRHHADGNEDAGQPGHREHEKAWIIRVTANACKDLLRSFFRSRTVSLDVLIETPREMPEDHSDILEAVLALPEKYKDPIYLHYYEGYTAEEIGRILGKNTNTVYTLLTRARQMLKTRLEGVTENG